MAQTTDTDILNRLATAVESLNQNVQDLKLEARVFQAQVTEKLAAIDLRFDQVDRRFEQVDQRFEQVDQRFEQVDKRFDQVDKRFEQVDQRFGQVDKRLDQVDQRLDRIERRVESQDNRVWTILLAVLTAVLGVAVKLAFFPRLAAPNSLSPTPNVPQPQSELPSPFGRGAGGEDIRGLSRRAKSRLRNTCAPQQARPRKRPDPGQLQPSPPRWQYPTPFILSPNSPHPPGEGPGVRTSADYPGEPSRDCATPVPPHKLAPDSDQIQGNFDRLPLAGMTQPPSFPLPTPLALWERGRG